MLYLQKSCKDSTEVSNTVHPVSFPVLLSSCIIVVHLSKLRKLNIGRLLLTKAQTFFIFTSFSTNVHFLLQDWIQYTTLHWAIPSPLLFWSVTVSQSFLVFHDLDSLRSTDQAFCRIFQLGFVLMSFSSLYWGYRFYERKPQRWNALLITSYQGICQPDLSPGMLTLIIWFR